MLLGPFKEALSEYVSTYVRQRLEDKATKLRDEFISKIGALRADLTVQRSADKNRVIDLPSFIEKRRRDGTGG